VAGLRALLGPRPTAAQLGVGVGIGLVCGLVLNLLLPPLLEVLLERVGLDPPTVQETARQTLTEPASRALAAVGVLVVAPLGEELAFRGVAFRALRRHLRLVGAGLASALLFAVLHTVGHSLLAAVYLLVSLGVVGAVLAVVVERQRHLWGAVLAHACFNAVAVGSIWAA
jgi:membrane protease YdiL (CAAX protease family)